MKTKKTKISLGANQPDIVFTTSKTETMAECKELNYSKRVAWHKHKEDGIEKLHKDASSLFDLYIEDVKYCLQ